MHVDVCRFSVDVTRNNDITSQGTKSTQSRVSSEGGEATCGQDKEGGGGEGEKKQLPMYMFTPVDRYGDSKGEMKPLQDLGMAATLCITCMYCICGNFRQEKNFANFAIKISHHAKFLSSVNDYIKGYGDLYH